MVLLWACCCARWSVPLLLRLGNGLNAIAAFVLLCFVAAGSRCEPRFRRRVRGCRWRSFARDGRLRCRLQGIGERCSDEGVRSVIRYFFRRVVGSLASRLVGLLFNLFRR